MLRTAGLLIAITTLVACSTPDRFANRVGEVVITDAAFRTHLAELSSDAYEGRAPASPGEQRTLAYLEQQFVTMGLRPVGGADFRQAVRLVEFTTMPGARMTLTAGGGERDFAYADEMVVRTGKVQSTASLEDSPLVFVGYGIVAPEYGWNDYAGIDMRGKTAVILVNDPGFVTGDPATFRGKAMTYHGRWTYKYEEAARQGAAGAIVIHDTEPAGYGWDVIRSSWSRPQFDMDDPPSHARRVDIEGWMTRDIAAQVLRAAGQDLAALERAAVQKGFKPVALDATLDVSVRSAIRRSVSYNVAGVIPGKERPDEYVIYMAHWDHLGKALSAAGDPIFNGAVDNATGVSGVLTIADAFRRILPSPQRSVMFLLVTAEESGLLGSAYYAANPLVPLEKTAAVINIDGMRPLGRARDLQVIGSGASELEDYLAEAADDQGRTLTPDNESEKGFYYRSDQFSLAKVGVPALYTKSGMDLREGGLERGRAMVADYDKDRYHRPADHYEESWDVAGSVEDLRLLFNVGYRVASETAWPKWRPDNEFRSVRDATAKARGE